MATTLDALTLPNELLWEGEYNWTVVAQSTERSITGSLIVQTGVKVQGKKITLKSGSNHGWVERSVLETLKAWAQVPLKVMALNYKGQTFNVIFDHEVGAIESEQVVPYVAHEAKDWHSLTLNFLTV